MSGFREDGDKKYYYRDGFVVLIKEEPKERPLCMFLGRCKYFSPENSLCLRPLRTRMPLPSKNKTRNTLRTPNSPIFSKQNP